MNNSTQNLFLVGSYLEAHQKILNSTHAMLHNCKHFLKSKILQGHSEIIVFDGLLETIYFLLDCMDGTDYIKML
jgi:hypothetical protein